MKTSQFVAMIAAIAVVFTVFFLAVSRNNNLPEDSIEFQTVDYTVPQKALHTSVKLLAVGDNLIHKPIYEQAQARTSDASYDFMPVYENLADMIAAADIAVINQETMMAQSYDVSTYPCFNTPTVMASQLASLGFDVLTIANNHMLDTQSFGLIETLDLINSTQGLTSAGAFHGRDEYTKIKTVTVNDISFAFLAYTEHTNGITIPDAKESYIVYLNELDDVEQQVKYASSVADVVVVSMHAGIEYSDDENDIQRNFAENVVNWGADVVIGTHPHTLQPVEYITNPQGEEVPVLYSLGNFVFNMAYEPTKYSAIVNVDVQTGEVSYNYVKIGPDYAPVLIMAKDVPFEYSFDHLNTLVHKFQNTERYIQEASNGLKNYRKSHHKAFIRNICRYNFRILKSIVFDYIKRRFRNGN
jgi:poly-gamma-glutamate synthesis protein (capsule biosynthesis protein)